MTEEKKDVILFSSRIPVPVLRALARSGQMAHANTQKCHKSRESVRSGKECKQIANFDQNFTVSLISISSSGNRMLSLAKPPEKGIEYSISESSPLRLDAREAASVRYVVATDDAAHIRTRGRAISHSGGPRLKI